MADIETLMPLIKQFMPFAQERMGFSDPPRLFVKGDAQNAANPLGKTAFYDPAQASVTIYITDRHAKDVMRSLSHELVHHTQNCNGDFSDAGEMGEGYAQNNPHMREMERQAYEMGNMCFRDWEDSIKHTIYFEHLQKGDYTMSTKDWKNGEIKSLLSEAWGFKMDLNKLNENTDSNEPVKEYVDFSGAPAGFAASHGVTPKADEKEKIRQCGAQHGEDTPEYKKCVGATTQGGETFSSQPFQESKELDEEESECLTAKTQEEYEECSQRERFRFRRENLDEVSVEDPDVPEEETKGKASTKWEKAGLKTEDSGEDEAWHQWKNEHADDDHIREIEHHLRALKDDRDYERHGAEHDDDRYEDEGMEERRARGRRDARHVVGRGDDARKRPGDMSESREVKLRAMVRKAIKEAMK